MVTGYFIDVAREEDWNNLEYWAPAGQQLSAQYTVNSEAQGISININARIINNSCPLGACSGAVGWAAASIQYGTSTPVTILAKNCGTQTVNSWFNYSTTLTSSQLSSLLNSNGIITITIVSCSPRFGSYNLQYELTASANVTESSSSQGSGSIDVTVTSPYGSPNLLYPATITATDQSTNQVVATTQITSASGTITGLNIGDNYTISVSMPPFADGSTSIELTSSTGKASISLGCGSSKYYQPNLIGQPQCLYSNQSTPPWLPALEIGIIGAGIIAASVAIIYVMGEATPVLESTNESLKGFNRLQERFIEPD